MKMPTWIKAMLILGFVFCLGAITGISITGYYYSRVQRNAFEEIKSESGDYFIDLQGQLKLNAEQTKSVYSIIEETREEYKNVCSEVSPKYEDLRQRARQRMKAILTSTQQEQFDHIVTRTDCNCPYLKKTP